LVLFSADLALTTSSWSGSAPWVILKTVSTENGQLTCTILASVLNAGTNSSKKVICKINGTNTILERSGFDIAVEVDNLLGIVCIGVTFFNSAIQAACDLEITCLSISSGSLKFEFNKTVFLDPQVVIATTKVCQVAMGIAVPTHFLQVAVSLGVDVLASQFTLYTIESENSGSYRNFLQVHAISIESVEMDAVTLYADSYSVGMRLNSTKSYLVLTTLPTIALLRIEKVFISSPFSLFLYFLVSADQAQERHVPG